MREGLFKMPDILGYRDRRADNPDFNPATQEIELGYNKREQIRFRSETRSRNHLLKKLYYYLERTGITKQELNDAGYSFSARYGNNKFYIGAICGKCGGLDEGRFIVDKKTEESKIKVIYKNEYEVEYAEKNNESFIKNLCDLLRIESAIKLRDFLDGKKIPYQEEPSRQKVKEELNRLNNRISGLVKKIQ